MAKVLEGALKSNKHTLQNDERILRVLLFGVAVFNVADYLLTLLALHMGYREFNPFIDIIVDTHFFPLVKLVVVPSALYFVWSQRNKVGGRILIYAWLAFAIYLLLMFYFKLNIWLWVL